MSQEAGSSRRISTDQAPPTVSGSQPSSLASTSSMTDEAAAARPVHHPTRSMAQPTGTPGTAGCTMLVLLHHAALSFSEVSKGESKT